jgi:hypothetical protein
VLGLAGLEGREKRQAVDGAAAVARHFRYATPGTRAHVLEAIALWVLRVSDEALRPVRSSLRGPLAEQAVTDRKSAAGRAVARLDGTGKPGPRFPFGRRT